MPTTTRPGFRKPWTHGAKAYEEADSLEDLVAGLRRARNSRRVYVHGDAIGHLPCVHCGIPLADPYPVNPGDTRLRTDKGPDYSGRYFPKRKAFVPEHYYCGWGALLAPVFGAETGPYRAGSIDLSHL